MPTLADWGLATQTWLGIYLGSFIEGQFAGVTSIWFVPILNVVFFLFLALMKYELIHQGTSLIKDWKIKSKIIRDMAIVSFSVAFVSELPYLLKHFLHG